jgi:4-amino-4-deoxy-L-arabinose transferase-like glycosyltransferase
LPANGTTIERSPLKLAGRLNGLLAWLADKPVRAVAALLVVSFVCFLPGQATIPAVDRDEARYVQATTQMLETGDFIDIRLHNQPRHYQPAGIYWLQAISVSIVGTELPAPVWVHRLPSLIGAILIVLIAYWAAYPLGDRRIALVAGLMMAAALLLNFEARLAKTDAALNASILLCQAVLLRLYLRDKSASPPLAWSIGFWVAIGIGVLVKGPILPLIVGLTIVVAAILARDIRWLGGLRPMIGFPIALAIALPWYVGIWFATDGAFFTKAIGYSVTGKLTTAMQSHGAPPGAYLVAFLVTSWPIAAVAVAGLPSFWRNRRTASICFFAAWVIPAWIVYELIATKLPHYVLPLYPAIALAAAAALVGGRIDAERWWVRFVFSAAALGPIVTIAIAIAAFVYLEGAVPLFAVFLGFVAIGFTVLALRLIHNRALLPAWLVSAIVLAPLTYACLFGAIAPRLETLWLSPRLAAASVEIAGCADPAVMSVGSREASLIFAVGTDIRFGRAEDAATFLAAGGCRAVIIERKSEGKFTKQLADMAVLTSQPLRVKGINIANGRQLDFGVYGSPR